jgi:hypothetical protein
MLDSTGRMKRFSANFLRIDDPILVGLGVTADPLALFDQDAVGLADLRVQFVQRTLGFRLDSHVLDPGRSTI